MSQLGHLLTALDATLPATADAEGSNEGPPPPPPPPPPHARSAGVAPPFVGAGVPALGGREGERKRPRDLDT